MLALETGIGPNDLIDAPPRVLDSIIDLLMEKAEAEERRRLKQELQGRWRGNAR